MAQTPKIPSKRKPESGTQYRYMSTPLVSVAQGAKRIDSQYYVEGYASTFDAPYELGRDLDNQPYYEVIASSAFASANMGDVIMQYDHAGHVFARQSNGSLIVEPDAHGLFMAADLSRSQASRDLYEEIAAGLTTKMSWAFSPDYASMTYDEATRTQTINKVFRVYDVSAVSLPADEDTEISARSFIDGVIDRVRLEQAEREKLAVRRRRIAILAAT